MRWRRRRAHVDIVRESDNVTDGRTAASIYAPCDRACGIYSKALRGPGSTVIWGPSVPLPGPQGLKLEARSADSGGGTLGCEGLLPGLGSDVSCQRQGF